MQRMLVDTARRTKRHKHLVGKLAHCHKGFRAFGCDRNHSWVRPEDSCSLRICPHCARRRSLQLAARLERFCVGREGLRYAVFTIRNQANLREGRKILRGAWQRLRRSKYWKSKVRGCVAAEEIKLGSGSGKWHPHLNVLMEGDYYEQDVLVRQWMKATKGEGKVVHISAANAGTVRELIKYVTKLTDLIDNPDALEELLEAIHGCRLVSTYGTFHGIVEDDDEQRAGECPDCGPKEYPNIVDRGRVPQHQVFLDFQGTLRLRRDSACSLHKAREDAVLFDPNWFSLESRRPTLSKAEKQKRAWTRGLAKAGFELEVMKSIPILAVKALLEMEGAD